MEEERGVYNAGWGPNPRRKLHERALLTLLYQDSLATCSKSLILYISLNFIPEFAET